MDFISFLTFRLRGSYGGNQITCRHQQDDKLRLTTNGFFITEPDHQLYHLPKALP